MSTDPAAGALLVNGTVGSGKSTTAEEFGGLLAERGTPHAVIDLDALRRAWPAPPDDPFHGELELANLAAVAAVHRRAGARRLVLAGVLETAARRARYRAAVGVPLVVVRLRVDVAAVQRRLLARHADDDALAWHLARSGELHAVLEAAGADDAVVEATGLDRRQAAEAVLRVAGWDDPVASTETGGPPADSITPASSARGTPTPTRRC